MYEIKPSKKPVKKVEPQKKQLLEPETKEMIALGLKTIMSLAVVGVIAFGGYKIFYKPTVPVWTNYDLVSSTGDKILHQQTISINNISSDEPGIHNPEAGMFLSIKKIDNKNAVWFIDHNNDFECISTVSEKCSLEISFDKNPAQRYSYDGGTMRTVYMIEADDLVKKIKTAKEIKISSRFRRVEMSPTKKAEFAMNNNGKYVDSFSKDLIFKVEGLNWQ